MTHVVVTRWYRSPELLFGAKSYGVSRTLTTHLNGLIPGWGGYLGSGLHPGRAPAPRSFLGRRLRSRSAVKDLPGLSWD